jgi:hypothetical protein
MNDLHQLLLDGSGEVPFPMRAGRRLTERQRELLRFIRWAGRHGSPIVTYEARVFYADPHGALRRLEALGLVCRAGRGCWKAAP